MILLMAFGYFNSMVSGHHKKVSKEMESLWPEIATKMTMVNLDAPNAVEAKGIGIEELFTLTDGKDTLGYYILLIVPSKLDKFDNCCFL